MKWRSSTCNAVRASALGVVFATAACARPAYLVSHRVMAVTLLGDSAVTLPVELRHSERATPILMIATRGVQNPHASEAYVQVLLARGDGRYDDLGTFTFFGAPPNEDEQLFVFALDEDQFQLLASKRARIRTVLKPMHAGGQISAVRIELKAWVEAHVP